jgi:hypothetical protein
MDRVFRIKKGIFEAPIYAQLMKRQFIVDVGVGEKSQVGQAARTPSRPALPFRSLQCSIHYLSGKSQQKHMQISSCGERDELGSISARPAI